MAREMETIGPALLHVRYAGRSSDVGLSVLDLTAGSSDARIKQSLARYLEVAPSSFDDYVIDRHANGNMTVRPEAVFG